MVDLSPLLPGELCSHFLADFGAEVIRVDEPEASKRKGRRGKQAQSIVGKPLEEQIKLAAFDCVGRNKKSLALDLKSEQGREVIYRLVENCDVFLEAFRPGVVKRLGVDYEVITEIKPSIVYCSISLYGQDGPYRQLPGHDPCALSLAGIIANNVDGAGGPMLFSFPIGDVLTGLHATIAILLALRVAEKTGKGQYMDISMTGCALTLHSLHSQKYFKSGFLPEKIWKSPSLALWRAKDDKFLCTTNLESHHWASFCRAIGRPDFVPYQHDLERRKELNDSIASIMASKTREEWLEILRCEDIQIAPVNEIDEALSDPQTLYRNMIVELEHPMVGMVKQLGIPIKLSQTPGRIASFAPVPGQDTEEILRKLGYADNEIEQLKESNIIEVPSFP